MMVVKKGKLCFSFITLWVYTFHIWGKHNILIVLTSENMKKCNDNKYFLEFH